MNLYDIFKTKFSNPDKKELKDINNVLIDTINIHIMPLSPGFAGTLSGKSSILTPVMQSVYTDLGSKVEPILGIAVTAKSSAPDLATAWNSSKSPILTLSTPSVLAGPSGPVFWQAILETVHGAIPGFPLNKI